MHQHQHQHQHQHFKTSKRTPKLIWSNSELEEKINELTLDTDFELELEDAIDKEDIKKLNQIIQKLEQKTEDSTIKDLISDLKKY